MRWLRTRLSYALTDRILSGLLSRDGLLGRRRGRSRALRSAPTLRSASTHRSATAPFVPPRSVVTIARRERDAGGKTPTSRQVRQRHYLIRRLVWLDTEGLLQQFARAQPWESGDALQDQLRSLEQRSPLVRWGERGDARALKPSRRRSPVGEHRPSKV
eukprot:4767353-Prymnesium_polylepis.1